MTSAPRPGARGFRGPRTVRLRRAAAAALLAAAAGCASAPVPAPSAAAPATDPVPAWECTPVERVAFRRELLADVLDGATWDAFHTKGGSLPLLRRVGGAERDHDDVPRRLVRPPRSPDEALAAITWWRLSAQPEMQLRWRTDPDARSGSVDRWFADCVGTCPEFASWHLPRREFDAACRAKAPSPRPAELRRTDDAYLLRSAVRTNVPHVVEDGAVVRLPACVTAFERLGDDGRYTFRLVPARTTWAELVADAHPPSAVPPRPAVR